jgi:threonine synthase
MIYLNINNPSQRVTLLEAVMRSVSGESGLYMPERIPHLKDSFFRNICGMTLKEIACNVVEPVFGEDISSDVLEKIVDEALNFEIPLVSLGKEIHVLELFHGPTYAFKDVGARFLAEMLAHIASSQNKEIIVLVATSGDTGGAVANAFSGKEGIKVVILYPSGRVSRIQEMQLLKAGSNIIALELAGDFDDCQRLVKKAFADRQLNRQLVLTSANSINFARLFPQSVYYFYAWAQLEEKDKPVYISVPSGNFGNLTAGLIAKKMGLPVSGFVASTNINKSVPLYLETGNFVPHPSFKTISNAMDVGNPSNFMRILSLYDSDLSRIKQDITGFWFTDDSTREGMRELYEKYSYIADPHTAVAYLGLKRLMGRIQCNGIFLATAHPGKFPEEVVKATGLNVTLPESYVSEGKESKHIKVPNDFGFLKDVLYSSF